MRDRESNAPDLHIQAPQWHGKRLYPLPKCLYASLFREPNRGRDFAAPTAVLAGSRLFVTAWEKDNRAILCLDRISGRVLWRRDIPKTRVEIMNGLNDRAAPTSGVRSIVLR